MTAGQFIGVDVGGTKVATAGLRGGVLSEPVVQPTEKASADALLEQIVAGIDSVRGPDAVAVGIGVPSVVEFATGRIRYSVNIPLADLPLRELLSARVGLPVFVENDASCAALSEAYEGERCVSPDLVMFTVGTGVGGGVVLGGKIFRGLTGAAPEMGHIIIGLDLTDGAPEPSPAFPQPGSLEWLATGGALAKLGRPHGYADGRAVVAAAQAGEQPATECVRILGERLGIGIATAINLFDPGEIVIGGGVSAAGDLLVQPAERVARQFALPGVGTKTTIRLARRGWEAGVLGAALLAAQEGSADEVGRGGDRRETQ